MVEGFDQALVEIPRIQSVSDLTHTFVRSASDSTTIALNVYVQAKVASVNPEIPSVLPGPISLDDIPGYLAFAAEDLIKHLDRSVMLRVRNIPSYPYASNLSPCILP